MARPSPELGGAGSVAQRSSHNEIAGVFPSASPYTVSSYHARLVREACPERVTSPPRPSLPCSVREGDPCTVSSCEGATTNRLHSPRGFPTTIAPRSHTWIPRGPKHGARTVHGGYPARDDILPFPRELQWPRHPLFDTRHPRPVYWFPVSCRPVFWVPVSSGPGTRVSGAAPPPFTTRQAHRDQNRRSAPPPHRS